MNTLNDTEEVSQKEPKQGRRDGSPPIEAASDATGGAASNAASDAAGNAQKEQVVRRRRIPGASNADASASNADASASNADASASNAGASAPTSASNADTGASSAAPPPNVPPPNVPPVSPAPTGTAASTGSASPAPTGTAATPGDSKPQIGDSRPAPKTSEPSSKPSSKRGRQRRGRGGSGGDRKRGNANNHSTNHSTGNSNNHSTGNSNNHSTGAPTHSPVEPILADENPIELNKKQKSQRRGAERNGQPLGRYRMFVSVKDNATHVSVTEGRVLLEHYVSQPAEDAEIDGNIYLGVVKRVLPGIEAAFIDIGTPKHGVIHRGDLGQMTTPSSLLAQAEAEASDSDNSDEAGPGSTGTGSDGPGSTGTGSTGTGSTGTGSTGPGSTGTAAQDGKRRQGSSRQGSNRNQRSRSRANKAGPRIEQVLKEREQVLFQVSKRPIGHKGARLTTEVSLPGRFVVLVPNSSVIGISRQIETRVAKRLRSALKSALPKGFGAIARTAAEHVTAEEIRRDVERLLAQWQQIVELSKQTKAPSLLFQEPEMALRVLRDEFSSEFREIVIDDPKLYEQVRSYIETISAPSADRIVFHDSKNERLPLMEKYQITEQLRKAVNKKVWLPSGGSLIIEHTEALTVIDVNTSKNVGSSSLAETLFLNNLEAAEEVARQLRLRDIGGIVVVDFVDMESKQEREQLLTTLRNAMARDKTRFSVDTVSSFGVVQLTRQRAGEGLLEAVSHKCENCEGAGLVFEDDLLSA